MTTRSRALRAAPILLLAASAAAGAGPREEVEASMRKFAAATSYHATMVHHGTRAMANEIDFVAPDRYRMKLEGIGTQYIIGDTMVMDMRGHAMRVPLPKGTLSQYRDPARLREDQAAMRVEGLGNDSLDGRPARKYRIRNPKQGDADVLMWVGGNGYPLRIEVAGKAKGRDYATTIDYSRFDDPAIRVQAP